MKRSHWWIAGIIVGVCLFFLAQPPAVRADGVLNFSAKATDPRLRLDSFMFSPNVVFDPTDGTIRLAGSLLVTDEVGATDFHQGEPLSDKVQAKKIFVLEALDVKGAELFIFGSAKEVLVNGAPLPPVEKLVSTGWSRVQVPTGLLKVGKNELVFKGGGQLLVEPGKKPGHSFKSSDGGKTWSREGLTGKGNQEGEYLVRLRLGKYSATGWAKSQILDLWQVNGYAVPIPAKWGVVSLQGLSAKDQPQGTSLVPYLRTGSTPVPDAKNWTGWADLSKPYQATETTAKNRWAQLKFELATTKGLNSPRVPASFKLYCQLPGPAAISEKGLTISFKPNTPYLLTSTPFVYQKASPRLKLLRERYKLDDVIAPGKTEKEKLMLLRYWVRNQWHTAWGAHPAQWMPPWDALMILESKDQPDCLTMCTHYAAVYTQCCVALGWSARHCILDHHCVAEVYMNDYGKWVMMDAGNSAQRADVGLHFEKNGVPMSARELHLANKSGKTEGIQVLFTPAKLSEKIAPMCRPAPVGKKKYPQRPDVIPLKELEDYPVCQINNYRRYAFPPRNNYLDTLFPGELYQGWSEYFNDGYCWVGDSPDNPKVSPEYSMHLDPTRPHEADWQLNWTQINLSRTGKPNQLRVDLGTFTPNFLHFERQVNTGTTVQSADGSFTWDLQAGKNTLTVWSVNQWNRKGMSARVEVTVP